ncbi:sensor histidine kinase, partial [Pseudactinotalea sp.]|uniref:sensor histidine kinase n=1 Tax=Pseudactinotalea sp. TaxID=1926260 RepID=UPI003B3B3FA1
MTLASSVAAPGGRDADMMPGTIRAIQLLLAGVLLFGIAVVTVASEIRHPTLLALGLMVTILATAVALVAPWSRLPHWAAAVLPALDAIAVGLLREASPSAGLGLLWAFPTIWAVWAFGVPGAITSVVAVSTAYWLLGSMGSSPVNADLAMIFPATIAVLACVTYVIRRRSRAQRDLLQRQSVVLRRATARAQRQEALVTDVLDAVDFGVVGFDNRGDITISNDAHHRLEQLRAGAAVYDADGLTALAAADEPIARAMQGETFDDALVWYGDPGAPDRTAMQFTARADPAGGAAGSRIVVTREVTDELLALRSREDLVDSVSHELRTPLTSILGYLDLASEDDLPESTRRSLAVAERNAERLLALVTDVLAASATSRMGLALRIEPRAAELSEPVLAAVESAQTRAAARLVTIDVAGVEPTVAVIDTHRIQQVMDNLIGNAIKYGRDGGRIEVGCASDGDHAWLVVRDDGPGVAQVDLPHVFDRFYRSDGVRKSSVHGSGLGLAISRDIVRAHGGEITVSSEPGRGASFV